jgi:hypothetical protein
MRTLILLAVLAVGCGDPANDPALKQYTGACLTRVFSATPLDASAVDQNGWVVRRALVDHGLMTEAEFCAAFGRQDIYVEDVLEVSPGHAGMHDALGNVWLNKTMSTLAHELLHVWDTQHGAVGTVWHEHWDTNGYQGAITEYENRFHSPITP